MLYTVGDEYWGERVVPYAGPDWPSYRAPSGITSPSRATVVNWAQKYYRGPLTAESVVTGLAMQSLGLIRLMELTSFEPPIDLPQVDAEGFNDEAIYHSGVDTLRPALVNFESQSLSVERPKRLTDFLESLGYEMFPTGMDTLAVLTEPPVGAQRSAMADPK